MQLSLSKKPKSPIVVDGFPGFGMVGAIATEFLLEQLDTEKIGRVVVKDGSAIAPIHEGKLVEPFGIYYNKKFNIVFMHAVMTPKDKEWELAELTLSLAKQLQAKEVISLEGVGSMTPTETSKLYYYTTNPAAGKKLKKQGMEEMNEGIVLGITAGLLLANEKVKLTALFAETHSGLPDSKAAASLVEGLETYLGLGIDTKPLTEMADQFEQKLRGIMQQSQQAQETREQKEMSYVG